MQVKTVTVAQTRRASEPASWRDFITLMKPRVMSLVIFTALVGLVAAPASPHPIMAMISVFAIALGAGAAGALNMALDADIDGRMRRTCLRPVPAGRVSADDALCYGLVMAALSVMTLALAANYVAAGLLAFTIFFYAVVYTLWLKRLTPQNIVIGGAAGAFPPMIGWAAATGGVSLDPVILFLIIFLWTPAHFWALALYKAGDYAKVGVPMMPVARGPRETRRQIWLYALALAAISLAPLATGLGGLIYAVSSLAAGAMFITLAFRVLRSRAGETPEASDQAALYAVRAGDKAARDLFAFSILYLFVVFAALLVEHGAP